jgi:MYXO-CTERM domain-containing protein
VSGHGCCGFCCCTSATTHTPLLLLLLMLAFLWALRQVKRQEASHIK